jgi:hypothetical protein
MPLEAYLERGRAAGFNIIYATSIVRGDFLLRVSEDEAFSLEALRAQLPAMGLELAPVGEGAWVIRRQSASSKAAPSAAVRVVPPAIEEVVVHSSRYEWSRSSASPTVLDGEDLVRRPVIGNDALRIVNQLPGTASVGISARPRVRGGREDETLVEFDDVRLYSPYHLTSYNSLYSAFDERVLGEVEFFSGAYPLSFGDGLSAVMSMSPPRPDEVESRREAALGLYQVSYFQSQAVGNRSWLASLRRSGPEAGELLEAPDLGHPEFADAFLRFEGAEPGGRRWAANLFWYGDDLAFSSSSDSSERTDTSTSNAYAWGGVESAPGETIDWNLVAGVAYLDGDREGVVDQPRKVRGHLDEARRMRSFFANQDFALRDDRRELRWGWDYRYLDLTYSHESSRTVAPAFVGLSDLERPSFARIDGEERAHLGAAYLGGTQHLGQNLFVDAELRLDAQRFDSRKDLEATYRLGALYRLNDALDLRLAWGRYVQAQSLHELPIADLDAAVGAPQRARQWVLGVEWRLPSNGATLKIEGYSKQADRVNPYYANLSNAYTLLPELQPDRLLVEADSYRAQGVEFSFMQPLSWGELWANYAYSFARDRVDGRVVARSWDQGRTLNAGASARLGNWEIALVTAFHEGWLTTPLRLAGDSVVAGERNSERFDHFLSVDVKAVRRWTFARQALRLELGLVNLMDRENIVGVDYALDDLGSFSGRPFTGIGLSPILDLYWSF